MNETIEQLINEVRLLYQSLVQVGEELHQGLNISMGMRAVLEFLDREGEATVPNMARARRVTRQHIQSLVNNLADMKLVASVSNPASKRSPLIALTSRGRTTIRAMREREAGEFPVDMSLDQLQKASQTLRHLRLRLEQRADP